MTKGRRLFLVILSGGEESLSTDARHGRLCGRTANPNRFPQGFQTVPRKELKNPTMATPFKSRGRWIMS
jgi:hypothetical protein